MEETTYRPSRWERTLGGIQWALSALVPFFGLVAAYRTYQMETRGWISFDWGFEAVVVFTIAFAAGFLWVTWTAPDSRTTAKDHHSKRVRYVFLIVAFPILWSVFRDVLSLLNLTPWVFRVAYFPAVFTPILWLSLPLVLVYGLDIEPGFDYYLWDT